jgi:hypothetical protein
MLGIGLEPKKQKPAASVNELLGVRGDLSKFGSEGTIRFSATEQRCWEIIATMNAARKEQKLRPRQAASLFVGHERTRSARAPSSCWFFPRRRPRKPPLDTEQLSGLPNPCVLAFVNLVLHPCLQAAAHLACTRPPDHLLTRRPLCRSKSHRTPRAFVTTSAGTDTMARRRQDTDEDEITETEDTADTATFGRASIRGTRQVTQSSMPADLRTDLAMPTTFGPKLFEIIALLTAVATDCKVKVKDAGDLLLLRDWLFEEIGPPYMWIVMISVLEWEHLTDDQKELHCTMHDSWLSSYSKVSHTVLQHWLWKFLKKQTETFAPLHKVFAKIKVDSGTSAWTEIFLLYPFTGASIAHNLLARGLKTCLDFSP